MRQTAWRGVSRFGVVVFVVLATQPGHAALLPTILSDLETLSEPGLVGVCVLVALTLFATVVSLLHVAGRRAWVERERALAAELGATRAALDRATMFLAAEPQVTIVWGSASGEPDVQGDIGLVIDAPVARRVLGFGAWLPPDGAQALDASVTRLRERGEGFRMNLVSLGGRHLEAEGRAVSGRAVLRLRDVSGDRLDLLALRRRHAELGAETAALRVLLDAVADAAWLRDGAGRLTWVNAAYVRGVEARDATDVLDRQIELLDRDQRVDAARVLESGGTWQARVPALVGGERHPVDATVAPAPFGAIGVVRDRVELEGLRADLERRMEAHGRTLDQLATAVATFDGRRRLIFHNAAYRQLWNLESAFLDGAPTDGEILDRLRASRRLPEEADFRSWKTQLHTAYQSVETSAQTWYLPGGRTLRVVVNPDPQGGVTYLFDDVTERVQIESQFNTMLRVQRETLDALREGVAVFGTDARLKLFNPALAAIGRVDPAVLGSAPRFDGISGAFSPREAENSDWEKVRAAVTGHRDERTAVACRYQRADGSALDCLAAPLPDGAMLLTFTDVTAQVNVERMLKESNTALQDVADLRNNFVHHVSFELRSPLTAIIGFSEMLTEGTTGPLTERQREYAGHIRQSSDALLTIIDDILDLATVDRDALELQFSDVDIAAAMSTAAAGVKDRLAELKIELRIVLTPSAIGAFRADAKRLRQVLFALLSNAIGFSEPGGTVTLAAMRRDDGVVFKVSDQGRGIPPDVLDKVFDRFQSHTVGSRHRGVGLGLSLVKSLVELHKGRVFIDSAVGEGTTVTCIFPAPAPARTALPKDGEPEQSSQ